MLNEYSGSATTKAATTVVEKVATVTTLSPQPLQTAESGMESLTKAASAAQDAADQAAAAAAALATKGAAATKAAAGAATAAAGGIQLKPLAVGALVPRPDAAKLPFVQVDPSKVSSDHAFDASARARENLEILKSNFMRGIGSFKDTNVDVQTGHVNLDINSLIRIDSVTVSPAVADFVASLHMKEYGGWYVAAAMAVYASQQYSAGREDAAEEFECELARAREKASEAASAAGLAAEGANTAKKLAMKMEKGFKKDGGQAILESSRSKMVQMEKDTMEKEMRAIQAEVASLRNLLATSEKEKKEKPTKTKVKTEIEEEYPTKVVMESDPAEDVRIIELLKALDEANQIKKKKAAEELEKKREEEAKFVAAEKQKAESRKMTKGVEAAQAKAEVAKRKKVATKKAKKTLTKVKSGAKGKTATKKSAPEKTAAKKASRTSAAVNNWATLAESTLKRKTVAQLTEYLNGKGVAATDSSGKSLKKAELLEAVKSL